MKKILFSFILLSITFVEVLAQKTNTVNVPDFKKLMEQTPNKIVLDVRTDSEVAAGVLPQAMQIDFYSNNFEQQIAKLDKNKALFVYCAVGGRSGNACQILATKGFKKVYNLAGGINAWRAAGNPTTAIKK